MRGYIIYPTYLIFVWKKKFVRSSERKRETERNFVDLNVPSAHVYYEPADTWPFVPTEARSISDSVVNWHRARCALSLFTTIPAPPIEGQCRNGGLHIIYGRVLQVDFKRTPPVRLRVKLSRERRDQPVAPPSVFHRGIKDAIKGRTRTC